MRLLPIRRMTFRYTHVRGAAVAVLLAAAGLIALHSLYRADAPLESALDVSQPDGWDADLALHAATDLNPDPRIVEIEIEARIAELEILPGRRTPAWTYNGTLPGPLIRATVGDRLVVHFTNSLPEATTIHWHGIHVPNDMDGAPGYTQAPVEPGGSFRYEFLLEDAGTFWYHPHMSSAAQLGRGLYGAIVVQDPDEPVELGDELVLVLSDITLEEDGQVQSSRSGGGFGDLFGREGNIVLVNGKIRPTLRARAGKAQRWRVINAARSRYFRLTTKGHSLVRIGGGQGLAARSEPLERFQLVPGERIDLVFLPSDEPGAAEIVRWVPVDRGWGTQTGRIPEDMLEIVTTRDRPVLPAQLPTTLRKIEPIDVSRAVEHTLEMTIARAGTTTVMGINGAHHEHARPLRARIGETHVWTLVNDTVFAHPFHLHGYAFQVLDDARIPEWKDTMDLPAKSELRIAVRFDARPGMWMYHCHILDHAEAGMMGHLLVTDSVAAPEVHSSHGHRSGY